MKIGLVGTGGFSKLHAGLLEQMEGVQVAAICGSSPAKAEEMAGSFKGAKGYGNIVEMLETEQLDAVYICVPPMAHGEIEQELIRKKIPFFVEKPVGVDDRLPRQLAASIEEQTLLTSVGYHFRYMKSVHQLKELLQDQRIGLVTGNWAGSMPLVSWWRNEAKSGGQFTEQTTHLVDLLRYLAGEIEEVHAFYGGRVMKEKYENVTVPDIGTVSMKLQNGIIANLSNTCMLPDGVGDIKLTFYTDQGIIEWSQKELKVTTAKGETVHRHRDNVYLEESKAFIQAVRTGETTGILSSYRDAVKTQQITYAAWKSAESGVPIKI